MKSILTILLIWFGIISSAIAQKDVPSVVTDGLNAYQKSGGKAALAAWLKGSGLTPEKWTWNKCSSAPKTGAEQHEKESIQY